MPTSSSLNSRPRDIVFDRTVSEDLLSFLGSDSGLRLKSIRDREPLLFDIQLRNNRPKGGISWATLYYGLTKLLDIEENGKGYFRLRADKAYRQAAGFHPSWSEWMPQNELDDIWDDVDAYLEQVRPSVKPRFYVKEGRIHAALASGNSDAFRIINREVPPSFRDDATKEEIGAKVWAPIGTALRSADVSEKWWPTHIKVGNSLDFLAVDVGGRLALIEAKHHSATGMIAKVAAQVGSYAALRKFTGLGPG